jgi:hypothetical protein
LTRSLSCSEAWSDFFKTQAHPPQYCPELRDADPDVPLGAQIFLQFRQCSIRLILDPQSQILDRFRGNSALAATWASRRFFHAFSVPSK